MAERFNGRIMSAHPNSNQVRVLSVSVDVHLHDTVPNGLVDFLFGRSRATVEYKVPSNLSVNLLSLFREVSFTKALSACLAIADSHMFGAYSTSRDGA